MTMLSKLLLALAIAAGGAQAHDAPVDCDNCADWNKPVKPFNVYGNTWYVGVDGLSSILVTSPQGHILLDGGLPQSAPLIEANIKALGFRIEDVKVIVNSHAHWDHAGGIAALQRASGAVVAASPSAALALQSGTNGADDPQFQADPVVHVAKVDKVRLVGEGETVKVGAIGVTAHMTPGHTPGGTTWTWTSCEGQRCLDVVYADSLNPYASGDFQYTGGGNGKTADISASFAASIAKVAALKCDIIISVHPDFTDVMRKAAARTVANNPFIDGNGCREYAADAGQRLAKRLAHERGEAVPAETPEAMHGKPSAMMAPAAPTTSAPSLAFTFDDGPNLEATPLLSPQQRNQRLLDALAAHHVQAALMVTAGFGANKPAGYALAKAWGDAGHAVGNHTMTHPDLHSATVSLAQYEQEVMDCDAIIKTLPGYQKWFRYTFLREGNTPEKRDGMRDFLKQQGYRNAYVSLDTSDWRLDTELKEVLTKNPQADIAPIKQAYLSHLRQRATAYRDLSRQLLGRDIPQVILMHHNLVNALWLNDAITQFEDMGWSFVPPAAAFSDPVYQLVPERKVPGQSLLLSISRAKGQDKFVGWERLVDDGDFEIDALKKQGL